MMRFSIDLIEFWKVFLTIQNSGAFDQDLLASPVWALARIGGRLSTQSNSRAPIKSKRKFSHGLIIWCRTDARGRINMGEAWIDSFQEPVERVLPCIPSFSFPKRVIRHKRFDWMNATLVVFKQIQSWAKRCQPAIAEGKSRLRILGETQSAAN